MTSTQCSTAVRTRFSLIVLLLLVIIGFVCWEPASKDRLTPQTWQDAMTAHFAGDEACKDCHDAIYQAHQRSGHSHTLISAHAFAVRSLHNASFKDPIRGYTFNFAVDDAGVAVDIPDHLPGTKLNVDWILGSGKRARTAVSLSPKRGLGVEHRWSLFGALDIGLTPAHSRFEYDPQHPSLEAFGRPLDWKHAMQCLGCHSTVAPLDPSLYTQEAVLPNVSCERCHGPRKEHVRLAKAGDPSARQPMLKYENAAAYVDQCGQCHRGEQHLDATVRKEDLPRFQSWGLKQSRCYKESDNSMTCSTCHDPHDAVSHDREHYRQACLSCHEGSRGRCPQPATSDCVRCHMSRSPWEAGLHFHDHRIAVPDNSQTTEKTLPSDKPQRSAQTWQ